MRIFFLISCLLCIFSKNCWAETGDLAPAHCEKASSETSFDFGKINSLFKSYLAIDSKFFNSNKKLTNGICKLQRSSEEDGKIRFSDGIYDVLKGSYDLNGCIEEANKRLGQIERMKTPIRVEDRYITTINYFFEDKYLKTTGVINLKDRKRPANLIKD